VGLHPAAAVRTSFHIWSAAVGARIVLGANDSTATPRKRSDLFAALLDKLVEAAIRRRIARRRAVQFGV